MVRKNLVLNFSMELTNKRMGLRQTPNGNIHLVVYTVNHQYQVFSTYPMSVGAEKIQNEIAADLFDIIDGETEEHSDACFKVASTFVPVFFIG